MFCNKVKEYLSKKGVPFTERDVSQDAEALAELEALGVMTTPVTVIGNETVIGFDRPNLERLLET